MTREFTLAYATTIFLFCMVFITALLHERFLAGVVSVFLLLLGGFLVSFGFWGADYAFSTALGEIDQSKQDGLIKGQRSKVYVPFMGNYSPTEWWNINFFLIAVGLFCAVVGAYFAGALVGF